VAHLPPNVPHSLAALEDSELVSAKGIVGGVGHRT
jgi:quercetin dioxygenase-like cupin family protein